MALSCEQAVKTLLKGEREREVRSAGKGSKGDRCYAWAWIATASPLDQSSIEAVILEGVRCSRYLSADETKVVHRPKLPSPH